MEIPLAAERWQHRSTSHGSLKQEADIKRAMSRLGKFCGTVFSIIRDEGNVADSEMLRTFNMGIGLTAVCSPDAVAETVRHLADNRCESFPIGAIRSIPKNGSQTPSEQRQ